MSSTHGTFVWYELMTSDPEAARSFYRDVVGWGASEACVAGQDYTTFTLGEAPVAGLMALPEDACAAGAGPGWVGYVGVDSVDASAARIADAGGSVHRAPDEVPGVGRFAIVADPQGATFALFQPDVGGQEPPALPGDVTTPGRPRWHDLSAADGEAAFGFYAAQFGWTQAEVLDMGDMGVYRIFAAGNGPIGGMGTKRPEVPAPYWLYFFSVEAIDAAAARVAAGGGEILMGPMEVPGGEWIVQCRDPQGAELGLVAPRR